MNKTRSSEAPQKASEQGVRDLPSGPQRFPVALGRMRRRFTGSSDIYVRIRVVDFPDISRELGDTLCRVAGVSVMEALRARAETVSLTLTEEEKGYTFRVRDDGTGMDHRLRGDTFFKRLRLIRSRVAELGGEVKVRDAAPRGVVLEVLFPSDANIQAAS